MDKFVITGGAPLNGEIATSGSKNSALPALAAALLTEETVVLHRIPRVRDIRTMERLRELDIRIGHGGHCASFDRARKDVLVEEYLAGRRRQGCPQG